MSTSIPPVKETKMSADMRHAQADFAFHKLKWGVQIDRLGACIATFFSALYLIFGVAHSVVKWSWSVPPVTSSEIGNELVYAIIFLFWPVMAVCAGAFSLWGGLGFIEYQLKGIKTTSENEAQTPP